jgi:hypothetical protein
MNALVEQGNYRVTFARVVRSEWTKFWSLRSTWVVLAATLVVTVALAGVVGWEQGNQADDRGQVLAVDEVVGGTFLSIDLFTLVIGVFGVLMMTGEYGTGLIRATITAVPRRLPVLGAKALVLMAGSLPVLLVACFGSFLLSVAMSGADVGLGDPGVMRAVVCAAVAPAAFGVIGLGLGTAVRHTAGAITTLVLVLLVLPALVPALPGSVPDDIAPYSPVAAGQAMYSIDGSGGPFDMLSPGSAAAVVAGWAAVALATGATVLRRGDA